MIGLGVMLIVMGIKNWDKWSRGVARKGYFLFRVAIYAPPRQKHPPLWGKITFRKGIIKMLELIVFAVVLVIAQVVGSLIVMNVMMKKFMTKEFIKKYTKMGFEVGQEIAEEMEEYLWE